MPAALPATGLYHHEAGAGEPLVLVHGSWSETFTWGLAMPALAGGLRVIAYDRIGHGQSPPAPAGPLARRRHEDDLAALIERVAGGRAHETVGEIVEHGDPEAGARHFVENVALGPGAWPMLPPEIHQAMVRNAPERPSS